MAFVIPTIFSAIDRVTPVAQRIEASIIGMTTGAGTATAALAASFTRIGDAMLGVATQAAMLGAIIVLPLALSAKEAVRFQKEMSNIATLVDTTKESVSVLGDEVLKLANRAPGQIPDLAESLYQIRSEGFAGAKSMNILEQSTHLAVSGLSTVTEATMSVASAMRVFESENITANEAADTFFKTVATGRTKMAAINESFGATAAIIHEGGVHFREMMAATAAMTNSGMTASEAMTAIRGAVIALVKPSGEMEKTLRSLGVTTGKDLVEKMGGLVPAMDAVGEAAKRNHLNVNESFGRVQGLTAYTLLTGSLRGQFDKDIARMNNGVTEVGQAYDKQMGTAAAKIQIAKNAVETLAIRTGDLLIPVLGKLADVLTVVVGGMADFAHNHNVISGLVTGGVALFGGFTLAIAGAAATIYVITKAIWLWQLAINAAAFAQAFLAVATRTETEAMIANTAAEKGAMLAMKLFTASTWQAAFASRAFWISAGLIGIALGVIGSAMTDDYDTVGKYNMRLDDTKDKFASITPAATQAALAMEAYNKAVQGINERVDFAQHRIYEQQRGALHGIAFDIRNSITHPLLAAEALSNHGAGTLHMLNNTAPDTNDFPGLDTKALDEQRQQDAAERSKIDVNINMTNSGGGETKITNATVSGNANVTPVVTPTYKPTQIMRSE